MVAVLFLFLLFGLKSVNSLSIDNDKEGGTPSSLVGLWYNELGSVMEIYSTTDEGILEGRYNSKVGEAFDWYTLRGTYDKDGTESGGTIAWTVTYNNEYNNSKSTCGWSGQRQMLYGKPVIYTTWLLTSQTESFDNWKSTTINQDFFYRHFPKDEKNSLPIDEKANDKEGSTPSSLVGMWYNELGSVMEIYSTTDEGILEGRYNSKVGEAFDWYTLRGTYDKDGTEGGGTIAWTVTFNNEYNNSKSSTAWSGQRQILNGEPVIYTTWLLTSQTESSDNWKSTTINQDFFYRDFPKNENLNN